MKNWVKRMVEQHAKTVVEINKTEAFLNNAVKDDKTPKHVVANMAIVVKSLKNLADAYQTILSNENVKFTPEGEYYEKVAHIK